MYSSRAADSCSGFVWLVSEVGARSGAGSGCVLRCPRCESRCFVINPDYPAVFLPLITTAQAVCAVGL